MDNDYKVDILRDYINTYNHDFLVYPNKRYKALEMIKNIEATLISLIILFPEKSKYFQSLWFDNFKVKCIPVQQESETT